MTIIVALFLGVFFGYLVATLLAAGAISDLEAENEYLRLELATLLEDDGDWSWAYDAADIEADHIVGEFLARDAGG